jgi:hypothetical protein
VGNMVFHKKAFSPEKGGERNREVNYRDLKYFPLGAISLRCKHD